MRSPAMLFKSTTANRGQTPPWQNRGPTPPRRPAKNYANDAKGKVAHPSLGAVFADYRVWVMALIYFCCVMGQYGLTLWMSTLIKTAGIKGVFNIGMFTAMQIVGTFAEFERAMLRERTRSGLLSARGEGRIGGRRPQLTATQQKEIVQSKNGGDSARLFNVHPSTVARLLARSKLTKIAGQPGNTP